MNRTWGCPTDMIPTPQYTQKMFTASSGVFVPMKNERMSGKYTDFNMNSLVKSQPVTLVMVMLTAA